MEPYLFVCYPADQCCHCMATMARVTVMGTLVTGELLLLRYSHWTTHQSSSLHTHLRSHWFYEVHGFRSSFPFVPANVMCMCCSTGRPDVTTRRCATCGTRAGCATCGPASSAPPSTPGPAGPAWPTASWTASSICIIRSWCYSVHSTTVDVSL